MERLDGKVALITGAARGQGRSHALRLAELGADIIAVDICQQIPTVPTPLATSADLAETASMVRALGRLIFTAEVDVRDASALREAVHEGAGQLGGIDIVLANAAIATIVPGFADEEQTFRDLIEVNLFGVWNTVQAAAPLMIEQGRGGAIVLTGSTQSTTGRGGNGTAAMDGYVASKHGVLGLMRVWASWLAPHNIRVNTVNPSGVATPMVNGEIVRDYLNDHPEHLEQLAGNMLPIDQLQPIDISNAIAWLVSDAGRYVTAASIPVDAGYVSR